MSYFSDIDLATLHRSRLNERIQYKLSWFNRRQKYYIPATVNQSSYNRNNQKPIKTSANHTFDMDHKRVTNGGGAAAIICEKNSFRQQMNNAPKLITNRIRKSASINKNASTSSKSVDTFARNHCDNSTDVVGGHIDEMTLSHQKQSINHNASVTNNVSNKKRQSTVSDTQASSKPQSLAANDANLVKKPDAKHGTVHGKCLSGDAINRNAYTMTDKTNNIRCAGTELQSSDQSIEEDLNAVPHRKRSGTWP